MSTRGPVALPRPAGFELHPYLGILGLAVVGMHAGVLLFHHREGLSVVDVLVPFAESRQRPWIAFGLGSAWALLAVTASIWLRKQIGGQTAWRKLHYLSFPAYAAALVHGLGAGPDTRLPVVYWIYVTSAAVVAALIVYRLGSRRVVAAQGHARAPRTTVSG